MVFKLAQQRRQLTRIRKSSNCRPCRFNRRDALFIHKVSIHARRIKIAVLLLQRTFRILRRRVQFLPQEIPVAFPEQRERTRPAHLVGRNRIVLDPVAARVLIKVRARVGGLVDRREIKALALGRCRGFLVLGLCRLRQRHAGSNKYDRKKTELRHRLSSLEIGPPAGFTAAAFCLRTKAGDRDFEQLSSSSCVA